MSLSHDVVTGQNTTMFAPYVYNGIGPKLAVGDGKQYSGTINGETITYFNGRINYYLDSNKNNKLDSQDQLKGTSQVNIKSLPNLLNASGTWTMNARRTNISFIITGTNSDFSLPFQSITAA